MIPQSIAGRQKLAAALILAADSLIEEWFFKDGIKLSVEDILPYLKTEENINKNQNAHESIMTWILRHQSKFDISRDGFYGRYVDDNDPKYYAFLKESFRMLAAELDFSVDDYLSWAKQNGKLICDTDMSRLTKKVWFNTTNLKGNKNCYCIIAESGEHRPDAEQPEEESQA